MMLIVKTYCGKTIKDNNAIKRVEETILLALSLDHQSYHAECCTLDMFC